MRLFGSAVKELAVVHKSQCLGLKETTRPAVTQKEETGHYDKDGGCAVDADHP